VVRPPLRPSRVGLVNLALGILFIAWLSYWLLTQFRDWTFRAEVLAFYAGGGGMALMFYRWRRRGDQLAKVLCLSAFGTWVLAVFTWGVGAPHAGRPGPLGLGLAAAALLTGFTGAIVVVIRTHRSRDSTAPPQDSGQAT